MEQTIGQTQRLEDSVLPPDSQVAIVAPEQQTGDEKVSIERSRVNVQVLIARCGVILSI
jgi:hypothetical protein